MNEPSEQQLLEALRQIKTEDVVVQTVATLVNLAGQKLSVEGAKDPAEAQKAIDAARQMLPLVPEEAQQPIRPAHRYRQKSPANRRCGSSRLKAFVHCAQSYGDSLRRTQPLRGQSVTQVSGLMTDTSARRGALTCATGPPLPGRCLR